MMVTKNALLDKTGLTAAMVQTMLGNSFLFSKGDERWKQKRKGVSHAFYKDKLAVMLDKLKQHVSQTQNRWLAQIASSD